MHYNTATPTEGHPKTSGVTRIRCKRAQNYKK